MRTRGTISRTLVVIPVRASTKTTVAKNTSDDNESDENPGVRDQKENRRSSRNRQGPERFTDSEHSPTFFQSVTQYQNIDATISTKQYGMRAGLKVFGDAGRNAVASEIIDNLHGRGVIEPVKK